MGAKRKNTRSIEVATWGGLNQIELNPSLRWSDRIGISFLIVHNLSHIGCWNPMIKFKDQTVWIRQILSVDCQFKSDRKPPLNRIPQVIENQIKPVNGVTRSDWIRMCHRLQQPLLPDLMGSIRLGSTIFLI